MTATLRQQLESVVSAARFNRDPKLAVGILLTAINQINEYKQSREYVLPMNPVHVEPTLKEKPRDGRGRPKVGQFKDILNSAICHAWQVGCNFPAELSNKTSADDSKFTIFVKNVYELAGMGKPVNSMEDFRAAKERVWQQMLDDEEAWKIEE